MAAKIFAFFALLALSVSAASAYISPVSVASATIIPQYFPQTSAIAAIHPCARYYAQLQALASGIFAPSSILTQQPLAILQQQCQAHLALQSIVAQQQLLLNPVSTLLPNLFNQLALANPTTAAYWQQQQLFPNVFNQVALPNVFNQLALVNPAAYWQQQQLLSNVFNQVALANPAAYLQQPFIGGAVF